MVAAPASSPSPILIAAQVLPPSSAHLPEAIGRSAILKTGKDDDLKP